MNEFNLCLTAKQIVLLQDFIVQAIDNGGCTWKIELYEEIKEKISKEIDE